MSNYEEIKIPDLSDEQLRLKINDIVNQLKNEQQITSIKSFDKNQTVITDYYKTTSKKRKNVEQKEKRTINIRGQEIELDKYYEIRDQLIKNQVNIISNKIKSKNKGKKFEAKDYVKNLTINTLSTFAVTNTVGQCMLLLFATTGLSAVIYIEYNSLPEDKIKYRKNFKEIVDKCFTKQSQKSILGTLFFGVPMAIHGGVKGGIIYGTGAVLSGVASVVAGPVVAGVISTCATWTAIKTFQVDLVKAPILSILTSYYGDPDDKTVDDETREKVANYIGTIISFPIPEKHFMKLGEALKN